MIVVRLTIASICLTALLAYLYGEKRYIARTVENIPVRICVTGTRGKSSVVRLVHAALAENGVKVLGKTTGSEPRLLLPDGDEEGLNRPGAPSILEQRRVLRRARELNVDVFVVEMMSIKPEYGYVESRKILQPNILGVTKVTLDHAPEMGDTLGAVSKSIDKTIPDNAKVIVGDETFLKYSSGSRNSVELAGNDDTEKTGLAEKVLSRLDYSEFKENVDLALKLAEEAGISRPRSAKGMKATMPDPGAMRAWKVYPKTLLQEVIAINGFAANEPESTESAFKHAITRITVEDKALIGLLNLRSDRGGRTLQWKDALASGALSELDRIYVIGGGTKMISRALREERSLRSVRYSGAKELMVEISAEAKQKVIVFGFGNFGGAGRELVDYWEREGERYGL